MGYDPVIRKTPGNTICPGSSKPGCAKNWTVCLTERVTPLKPLEAMVMAMGKALVASDVGGHK